MAVTRRGGSPGSRARPGDDPEGSAAAWGVASPGESRWPALGALVVAMLLQLVLPGGVLRGLGPRGLVPGLELGLLAVLIATRQGRISKEETRLRWVGLAFIALVNIANLVSLAELIHQLLYRGSTQGRPLIYASVPIWATNVIVFGLWFWELDRGGPAARQTAGHRSPDFLFPQMTTPESAPGWTPSVVDYLYTSFTNATAFSPTDTMPLTAAAKWLMALESTVSLVTVAVVISRAVNVLG